MARCARCGGENDDRTTFCGACGAKFVAVAPAIEADEDGLYYCFKHKKETTRVTCGRCERPICPKCMVVGASGVRCHACAKNRTPVRVGGVLHDVTSGVGRTVDRIGARPVWYLWIWATILRIIASFFGR